MIKSRGYGGFIIEDKQTDVRVDVATPLTNPPAQFAHARAPIPALGGVARYWIVPRVNVTGEVTGFKIPDSVEGRYKAHYVDIDVYGTVNATKNVGVKVRLPIAWTWATRSRRHGRLQTQRHLRRRRRRVLTRVVRRAAAVRSGC